MHNDLEPQCIMICSYITKKKSKFSLFLLFRMTFNVQLVLEALEGDTITRKVRIISEEYDINQIAHINKYISSMVEFAEPYTNQMTLNIARCFSCSAHLQVRPELWALLVCTSWLTHAWFNCSKKSSSHSGWKAY